MQARGLDPGDVREALVLCGMPARAVQPSLPATGPLSRLTDPALYGGTHRYRVALCCTVQYRSRRNRFDSAGRGRGVAGRRDIRDLPPLWPRPTQVQSIYTASSLCC